MAIDPRLSVPSLACSLPVCSRCGPLNLSLRVALHQVIPCSNSMFASFIKSIALASSSGSSSATPFSPAPDDVSYTELNEYLELLCEVFPEADVDEVRERLRNSSPESRLHLVTETLLKNPARGARRNAAQKVAVADKFRSVEYQRTARGLLYAYTIALSYS